MRGSHVQRPSVLFVDCARAIAGRDARHNLGTGLGRFKRPRVIARRAIDGKQRLF
jgi:hypothetical protein